MNINEHLAINVMGWVRHTGNMGDYYLTDNDPKQAEVMWPCNWNPSENIEQAFMCLNTFENVLMTKDGAMYSVSITDDSFVVDIDIMGEDESLAKAISLACAKATGWTE